MSLRHNGASIIFCYWHKLHLFVGQFDSWRMILCLTMVDKILFADANRKDTLTTSHWQSNGAAHQSMFVFLVADDRCWFVLREKYCWLIAGGWFVLTEKYCWLVADKPNEQAGLPVFFSLELCNFLHFMIYHFVWSIVLNTFRINGW
jgi:hypothetical protein